MESEGKRKGMFISRFRCRRGLSLVEILTTLFIIAAALGVFYAVFITNWTALESYMVRAQLWEEAGVITRRLTDDGRLAKAIYFQENPGVTQTVRFHDRSGTQFAEYTFDSNGDLKRTDNLTSTVELLSENVYFAESTFSKDGPALQARLTFQAPVLTQDVKIVTENEIFPRNYLN